MLPNFFHIFLWDGIGSQHYWVRLPSLQPWKIQFLLNLRVWTLMLLLPEAQPKPGLTCNLVLNVFSFNKSLRFLMRRTPPLLSAVSQRPTNRVGGPNIRDCGAQTCTIIPLSLSPSASLQSLLETTFPFLSSPVALSLPTATQMKWWPEPSSPYAISMSCSSESDTHWPKQTYKTELGVLVPSQPRHSWSPN